ncbi:MAG: FGGY-family carbohydrate kinase [Devosiaceae bacterium]|nr:FGGY-family carbohydrate kinase [Devosiaceae bacterium MH13]
MQQDLVIGIDSSTSATKATAWTKAGMLVAEGRQSIPISNPNPGTFEQDPGDWWASTVAALKQLLEQVHPSRVAAVSISNQRETFGVFRDDGTPVRPAIVWLDERGYDEAERLAEQVGPETLRGICGKPIDVLLPIVRLIWLAKYEPDVFSATERYSDVHGYLAKRLTSAWVTSTASADPSGMLDCQALDWSDTLLEAAGVPRAIMPGLARPGTPIGEITAEAADATGLLAGTMLIAGGGDGQCAATGAGATQPGVAYMNLGTAVVAGVYSPAYGHDQAFRTETAVADDGYIFETVLKSGTFLIDWFQRELGGGASLEELEVEASASPIGSGGIALLPFWQGSMTPHWDAKARGIIAGLSGSSKRGDVYRALLEGLALDQAYALEVAVRENGADIDQIIAIGGGAASPLLLQIVADATNIPVSRADVAEASALGAAICAAKGAGWFPTVIDAARAMTQTDLTETKPVAANVARYKELRAIYDDLWPTLSTWNARMWSFANA